MQPETTGDIKSKMLYGKPVTVSGTGQIEGSISRLISHGAGTRIET
jgi:hypothetical protein